MTQQPLTSLNKELTTPVALPTSPAQVSAQAGQRWVAVTWQPPTLQTQIDHYLLFVSPGQEVICLDADTTHAVLTQLRPDRTYTFLVATRNSAGASDWVASLPLRLENRRPLPAEVDVTWNTGLLADLWGMDESRLSLYLATQDDADLLLALRLLSVAMQDQLFTLLDDGKRVLRLRERLTGGTALMRRASILQPPPPPEPIIIEMAPRRKMGWGWSVLGLLIPVLLLGIYLMANLPQPEILPPIDPLAASVEKLEGTVEALVAKRIVETPAALALATERSKPSTPTALAVDTPAGPVAQTVVDLV